MGYLDFLKKVRPNSFKGEQLTQKIDKVANITGSTIENTAIYPSDLWTDGNDPYVLFIIRDYGAKDTPIKFRTALYMPPTVQVSYGAEWQNVAMPVDVFIAGGQQLKDANEKFTGNESPTELKGGALDAFVGVSGALGLGNNAFSNFAQREAGKTVNPQEAVLFKNVSFRSFSFTFQLMARNEKESQSIKQIIKQFKKAMHPGVNESNNFFWTYPDMFDIKLLTPKEDQMFNISRSALVDMNVDYAGSGIPSFFGDTGAPVDIRMTLTFRELDILTKEKIDQGF